MSFGYNISVTPLQLTTAFCALVNGGILYRPQIVKKLVDKNGNIIQDNSSFIVRRVISENTSDKMREILKGAVEHGTGKLAKIDSLSVGGKTGTSKLVIDGKYSDSQYYSSFIGFYPVEKPEIVCYVLINKPKGEYYGGLVSAPVFKNIMKRIHELDNNLPGKQIPDTEIKITQNLNSNTGSKIAGKDFRANEKANETKNIFISANDKNIMPDLRGKTIKEAVLILNDRGVRWRLSGTGIVVEQSILPGEIINAAKTCMLNCSQIVTTGARIY
jgi:membrane peptidoglycan carboxypeptidase